MPSESISLDDGYDPDGDLVDLDDYDRVQADAEFGERRKPHRERASRIPEHAPRPQDHQPKAKKKPKVKKSPQQREAEGIETVEVEFDGETYEIPADPIDWEIDVTEAFETGRMITACRGLLGPEQFAVLSRKGYRNRDFRRLFKLLAEAGGFESLAK